MSQHLSDYYANPDLQEQARQTLAYVHDFLTGHDCGPPAMVADLGCGIGSLAVGLAQAGWQVMGVDYALSVLAVARLMGQSENVEVDWVASDILTWSAPFPVQAVTCFDVLNHVLETEQLETLFARIYQHLAPGGYFLCDANTLENFQSPIWNYDNRELTSESYRATLHGWFDSESGRVYAQTLLTMETPEGPETTDNTLVCQYHPTEELLRCLETAGFEIIGTAGYSPMDLTQVIPGLKFTKTRFECRKPD